ncbi:MAG: CHAT domain-containing protein [Planctomycetes bacterium]|nr:CHAT domain-containing protein [Planctomycetota bacterium]
MWTKILASSQVVALSLWSLGSVAKAQEYPQASLDQATFEMIESLDIPRYKDLSEDELQAEYQWALDMARLCLGDPESIRDREGWWTYATEFQRHAGRTARYRGFGEQAIRDYETAIGYAYESARLLGDAHPEFDPEDWEKQLIWRDIADTYFMMSAYELAAAKSILILERERLRGKDSACDLDRLARIAQRQERFADSVGLQHQAVEATRHRIVEFLEQHPELNHVDPDEPWDRVVFLPEVERVLDSEKPELNAFREVYYRLGRALRLNGQLAEAEHALATAKETPWVKAKFYRQNLDLYVDREWAFLALAKGEAAEALAKAEFCLDEYVMSPAEEIELLDLVSRAKEALGDLDGAMEALEAAIEIVETRRANLVTDEFKQSYAAGYAELYRRALDLVANYELGITNYERRIREQGTGNREEGEGDGDAPATSHQAPGTSDASRFTPDASRAFQWAERLKGRAMLDAINRYDQRMKHAIASGHTEKMKSARKEMREVVSIKQLQDAEWLPGDTALIEYAFGANGAVYVWAVSRSDATFQKLRVNAAQIDDECARLSTALRQHDDAWVEPAAKLYEHTIRPIADRLRGIEKLVIVGDGKLRTVPFEVFISSENADENRYIKHRLLIEDYAVSYAPSATTLEAISTKTQHADVQYTDALWAFASTKFGAQNVEMEEVGNREKGKGNVEMEGSRSRGAEESSEALYPKPDARSLKPGAHPANHKPQITNHDSRAFAISCVTPDRSGSTTCRTPDGK